MKIGFCWFLYKLCILLNVCMCLFVGEKLRIRLIDIVEDKIVEMFLWIKIFLKKECFLLIEKKKEIFLFK